MTVEELELAINEYLESNKDALNPCFGNCKGLEPFGEPDLGDIINSGNLNEINKKLETLSNFSEINFGLFGNKQKTYKNKGNPYFDLSVSVLQKLDAFKKGEGTNLFMKIIDYILKTRKKTGKPPVFPKTLAKANITEQEYQNMVTLLQ